MTLVVAQITDNGIISISDTKLTFKDSRRENPYFGALKSHMLGTSTSSHFAGNTYWAKQALEKIDKEFGEKISSKHFIDIQSLLLEIHRESSNDTDFLLIDSEQSKISRISEFTCIENCQKAYIGDSDAHQLFTKNFEKAKQELIKNNTESKFVDFLAISKAFNSVIEDASITSVDGLDISIAQEGNHLLYQLTISAHTGQLDLKIGKEPVKIPLGSTSIGSHSVSFLSSQAGEWPQCLGVHLHFGNIGILWGPSHHLRPIVITNCSHEALVNIAKNKLGASINGMLIS